MGNLLATVTHGLTAALAPLLRGTPDFSVVVHTGNKRFAGTDGSVSCILHCEDGEHSQVLKLSHTLADDFQRGAMDVFDVPKDDSFGMNRNSKVVNIEIWRRNSALDMTPDWFVDRIEVVNRNSHEVATFPVLRWLEGRRRYHLPLLDTCLPQDAPRPAEREDELVVKRAQYTIDMPLKDDLGVDIVMCGDVNGIPEAEEFPFKYEANLGLTQLGDSLRKARALHQHQAERWGSLDELLAAFDESGFDIPSGASNWNDDSHFGALRLQGLNNSTLRLVTDAEPLPGHFPVTDELVGAFLEGRSLHEAVAARRVFLADLHAVARGTVREGRTLCAPLALFYQDDHQRLLPVAIQLQQQAGEGNPIFTPGVSQNLWTLVKMWYNNADAAYHQAIGHLGSTHFVVEGAAIVSNRQLSLSHPVYKLLAPHFLYLIALDNLAKTTLINPGGIFDTVMSSGRDGMLQIAAAALQEWRMDTEGCLPADLARRGLQDPDVLPNYHFRSDALLLWQAISQYVHDYVALYYPDTQALTADRELQNWAAELVKERNPLGGGLGMKGVPGDGRISHVEQLAAICTSLVFTSSAAHAAANFPQYDTYAFTPNYPSQLLGKPPTSRDMEATPQDILNALPSRADTYDSWIVSKLLSEKNTESLGFFEVEYIFDPAALVVLEKFRKSLKDVAETIEERNRERATPYDVLHPQWVPNAISI